MQDSDASKRVMVEKAVAEAREKIRFLGCASEY